ncbi:MAG TPA: hypothetical protein VGK25_12955 [Ignavibacteria bacterium]
MNIKIAFAVLFIIIFAHSSFSQWPGYFIAFELKDQNGNSITAQNDYKMTTVACNECTEVLLGIDSCTDKKTWRFYEGYKEFDKVQMLRIEKMSGETMVIEFPPRPPRERYKDYSNLYAGEIKFINGTYKIGLPNSKEEWDNLTEVFPCPDQYNYNGYGDISNFQK